MTFPDKLNLAVPEGVRAAIERACSIHGVSISDYLREAVAIALGVDGIDVPAALQDCRPDLLLAPQPVRH